MSAAGEIGAGGRLLADDVILQQTIGRGSGSYGIDYSGARSGYAVQNIWEKTALEEAAASGGGVSVIDNLGDPALQAVSPGRWEKWQVTRVNPTSGEQITIHYSKSVVTQLIDDVKIVFRGWFKVN